MGKSEVVDVAFSENHARELLWNLLFKDYAGNPYGDECSQNRIIRRVADKFKIDISKPDERLLQQELFK